MVLLRAPVCVIFQCFGVPRRICDHGPKSQWARSLSATMEDYGLKAARFILQLRFLCACLSRVILVPRYL